MRSSGESTVSNAIRELAHQLIQKLTPEGEKRLAEGRAEVHEVIAALSVLAARVERLRATGRQHQHAPDCDMPHDIPKWKPGDSMNMPGDLGGEFFETDPEAWFWGELDLQGLREELASAVATLARDLESADPYHALTRAEELLARLPSTMLDALHTRLAELETQK